MATAYPSVPGVRFKDVARFPGYCVGDDGSIWSNKRRDCWTRLATKVSHNGYEMVTVSNKGRLVTLAIHREVLTAFIGPCPKGYMACHYDNVRTHNKLCNLRWDTHAGNERDKKRHGTIVRGINHCCATLTESQVLEIRRLHATGMTGNSIARLLSVGRNATSHVIAGRSWKHI